MRGKSRTVVLLLTTANVCITIWQLVQLLFPFIKLLEHIKFKDVFHASSIGIIGGADGPTAIFVTGKQAPQRFGYLLRLLIPSAAAFCGSLALLLNNAGE